MKLKSGGMRKVRIKTLKRNCRNVEKLLSRKHQNRIDLAVNSSSILKERSPHICDLITERSCLHAEITAIRIRENDSLNSDASKIIKARLKRIELLNRKLDFC